MGTIETRAQDGQSGVEPLSGSPAQTADESSELVSVVVPLHNERPSLRTLYAEIADALKDRRWELVFVDDGSNDGSYEELVQIHAEATNVRALRLRRNFGKSTALAIGFAAAQGDAIITIDADLQDDPAEIPRLMAKLDEGFDLVSGWKRDRQDTAARRAVSRVYNTVTAVVTGVRLHDMNCGLKAYRAEVVRNMAVYGDLHRFLPALAQQRGYRVAELSVNHRPRAYGVSRYGLERYVRGFFDLLTVAFMGRYRSRPLHLFGGMGMLLGLTGFVILVYLTGVKLAGHGIGQRPLLLLGALLVVVGVQLFAVGLVGELITSHHAERTSPADKVRDHVRDILE